MEVEVARDVSVRLYPRLPDYMVAARKIYKHGSVLTRAAEQRDLDDKILEARVDYLKPGAEFRLYLEK